MRFDDDSDEVQDKNDDDDGDDCDSVAETTQSKVNCNALLQTCGRARDP